ncbi:flagellar filament capping protein FliD [Paenibacillus segetis]|uniref:Flagellar hook-associated protein 2 n=1 Tax=Paenibacillus segetis TaxID=1325360 RepID=A0ABQ1YNZ8_9BACL|nr:flagellar filament capping protein FliD [Paenibacillus segetis]GGH33016.1 flagellar hook-associated protein 2 [Paenibacillus segetis]
MGVSITGLSGSGINTKELITAIMNEQKIPLNSLNTKKEITTAYKDFFTALNTKMASLRDAATALSDISSYSKYAATSSNTNILSASVEKSAAAGSYSVKVTQLAQSQTVASQGISATQTFGDSKFASTMTINGQTIYLTEDALKAAIKDAEDAGDEDKKNELNKLTSLGIEDATAMGDALSRISKAINGLTDVGVQASVIQTSDGNKSLVLTASKSNEITFTSELATLNSDWIFTQSQEAKDAKFTINGLEVTSKSNTIENAIEGVTLTLSDTGSSTVKVSQDVDALTSQIQTFVTAYNDIVKMIRDNTAKSTQNSDGSLSLTLQGDSLLRDLQSQLNSWMNQQMGDTDGFKLLSDIGLEIDKGVTSASLMTGKITFDSELFKKKMLENPEAVQKMLSGTSTTEDMSSGMGSLFKDNLKIWTDSVDGLITTKIKGYSSEISFLSEQITSMSDRLNMKQAALEKKYANMEVMLSSLKSQSDYVSNMLKTLTKSSD